MQPFYSAGWDAGNITAASRRISRRPSSDLHLGLIGNRSRRQRYFLQRTGRTRQTRRLVSQLNMLGYQVSLQSVEPPELRRCWIFESDSTEPVTRCRACCLSKSQASLGLTLCTGPQ